MMPQKECACCHRLFGWGSQFIRGLCHRCYPEQQKNGTLGQWPTVREGGEYSRHFAHRSTIATASHQRIIDAYQSGYSISSIVGREHRTTGHVRKVLRDAGILQPKPPAATKALPVPRERIPYEPSPRNAEIIALWEESQSLPMRERKVRGLTLREIARRHDLSATRVQQIYRKHLRRVEQEASTTVLAAD